MSAQAPPVSAEKLQRWIATAGEWLHRVEAGRLYVVDADLGFNPNGDQIEVYLAEDVDRVLAERDEEIARLKDQLGECYKQAGADTDGDENWRNAPHAVEAVKELMSNYNDAIKELMQIGKLEQETRALREALAQKKVCARCEGRGWIMCSETRNYPNGLGAGAVWNEACPDCKAASPGAQKET